MSSPQVLRVPNRDGSGHLLVHIIPEGKGKTLNLKLTGTDTDVLFETSIKESSTEKHQSGNFSGSTAEWNTILAFVLLHARAEGPLPDHLKGVDIVAEIIKSTFTITIRKIVGGITQILGRIELKQRDIEVDLLDWVEAAAASSDQLRLQLQKSQTRSTEQQDEIRNLTAELDRLVQAKKDHERELLSKFAVLLNEKKLKIRDQQRLLSHAQVSCDAAEDAKNQRSKGPVSRKAGASRSKRKARDEDGDDDNDGAEDDAPTENDEQTPAASDVDTADERTDEDEGVFAPAPEASQASTRRSTAQQSQSQADQQMSIDDLPPARSLPFSKARAGVPNPSENSAIQNVAEEDEETEDDEL